MGAAFVEAPLCTNLDADGTVLLKSMLVYDQADRISAKRAMQHKFLCERAAYGQNIVSQKV